MRTDYRIDDFQECYFVIGHLDELLELARIDFGPMYQEVEGLSDYQPGDIVAGDAILTRGTGLYHEHKRKGKAQ